MVSYLLSGKIANVLFVHNKEPITDPRNYTWILLTFACCRVMKRINNQLLNYLVLTKFILKEHSIRVKKLPHMHWIVSVSAGVQSSWTLCHWLNCKRVTAPVWSWQRSLCSTILKRVSSYFSESSPVSFWWQGSSYFWGFVHFCLNFFILILSSLDVLLEILHGKNNFFVFSNHPLLCELR